ncbi:MAG: histidine phosphatase family protein [Eubacteriaceae bacterium]|nr:histidine phosphatase family protein [Eubacteriaceae bacterium]
MGRNSTSAGVILAAGYSSRMGAFKPLLPLGGKTVIETVIDSATDAGIEDIVVVTGYDHEKLEKFLKKKAPKVRTAFNPDHDEGMFTSIKAGLRAMDRAMDGCFIMPVDCPVFGSDVLKKIIRQAEEDFAVPVYMGKKGHPLFVPSAYWEEIISYDGPGGLKGVTDKCFEKMKRIPVDTEGVVLDMDDPAGYEEVKRFADHGSGPSLREMAAGRRIFLIRHGQIRQHREKIFLGRTDEPLSEEGRRQAEDACRKLAEMRSEYGKDTDRVYSSSLRRAMETAELLKAGRAIPEDGLAEMSLGSWDGRFISEIKEKYPEQYEMRGRNIFSFKTGNGSENFYDVQYRAVKAMKRILEADGRKEIIIVAHKGVLRAIENNLYGKSVDDDWKEIKNCEIRMFYIK